jgi:predicted nucleic acid-binding protein
VRIIVDANIVFSAILNTNSKIADLILNSKGTFEFLAPDYLQTELHKYFSKISKITRLTISEIKNIENKVTKPIIFMSGIHISEAKWIMA